MRTNDHALAVYSSVYCPCTLVHVLLAEWKMASASLFKLKGDTNISKWQPIVESSLYDKLQIYLCVQVKCGVVAATVSTVGPSLQCLG